MNDAELDAILAGADPLDGRALDALRLEALRPELAPVTRRATRRRLTLLAASASAAAVAVLLLSGGDRPDRGGTAWAAPLVRLAEDSPQLLIDAPGWTVTRADESDAINGEMTFTAGGRRAELNWRGGPLSMWRDDRAHSSVTPPQDTTVLGQPATVYAYGATDLTAIWPDGDRVLELRATVGDRAAFLALLGSLRRVDVDRWLSAMPASVVKAGQRAAAVDGMLDGVAVPPGFDRAPLERSATEVTDRYQLGAKVTKAVTCAWVARWEAARRAGDDATAGAAVAAMASARHWPILVEMSRQGDFPRVLEQTAEQMRHPDGAAGLRPPGVSVREAVGCG